MLMIVTVIDALGDYQKPLFSVIWLRPFQQRIRDAEMIGKEVLNPAQPLTSSGNVQFLQDTSMQEHSPEGLHFSKHAGTVILSSES